MMPARRGFTLLEAIVALAIVGVVCVGVLASEASALRAEATAVERLPLVVLAEERIAAIDVYPGALDALPDSVLRGTFAPPFAGARWDARVVRVAETRSLFEITVVASDARTSATLVTRRHRPSP
ncbi:MAG: type II secretion system protein [Gemmatimonadaceae bacterium]